MRVTLSPDYVPSEEEEFMNPMQLEFFRQMLLGWRSDLVHEAEETLSNLNEGNLQQPDMADRASLETDHQLELRTRDRERKLLIKIDEALSRIDDESYGFCQDTDEPIGLKRLMARPIAVLSLEAQERHERQERTHREE
ncbi:MAG: RNA polymerase-binding protein DksA [Rhodospirillaceae bacterium]|jgi:DnaK suppressor protein|nr:RNA polymerase-binding protein DksA [Rhodospirillaceae bacterium]